MIKNKKKIIEKLRDDEQYYGEFGQQFLSNSNIYTLQHNPLDLRAPHVMTTPLLVGAYFHHRMLEPEKADDYEIVEIGSRGTKHYKEQRDASGKEMLILRGEVEMVSDMEDALRSNSTVELMTNYGNIEREVPNLVELEGKIWKCKADILNHDDKLVVDLKSTSNILNFSKSAWLYNYDSQAYIYSKAFGYNFLFIVIDKESKQIGIFDCSEEFLERGKQKVVKAVEDYKLFYETPGFNPKDYFKQVTL